VEKLPWIPAFAGMTQHEHWVLKGVLRQLTTLQWNPGHYPTASNSPSPNKKKLCEDKAVSTELFGNFISAY
jgi:hypothetical protein